MRYSTLGALAVLAGAASLAGCRELTNQSEQLYQQSLQRWEANGPPSYDLVLTRSCVCEPAVTNVVIQVRGGTVTGRNYQEGGDPVPSNQAASYPDIPALFNLVLDAIRRRAYAYEFTFNGDYGYPEYVFIDYTPNRSDDNLLYAVPSFTPVP